MCAHVSLFWRAKNIRNRPEVNQKISKTAMIKEMSSEMEKLRMELVAQREKNGVYIATDKHQQVKGLLGMAGWLAAAPNKNVCAGCKQSIC